MSSRPASVLFSLAITILVYLLCGGRSEFWDTTGAELLSLRSLSVVAVLLFGAAIFIVRGKIRALSIDPLTCIGGLVLVFFSDWLCRPYSYFQGPTVRGEIILGVLPFLVIKNRVSPFFWKLCLISTIIIGVGAFLSQSAGRLLFSDDHSTFIYRLSLLKDNFPRIPFYYPLWNGGIDARDFFATGALNIFFLASPIIYLTSLFDSYNYIVLGITFILLPLSLYYTAKLEEADEPIPAITAIVGLTSGLIWYKWAFKYGTMGFITTSALIPLNLSLALKLIDPDKNLSRWQFTIFILSMTLMLFWSPSALVFFPLGVIFVTRIKSTLRTLRKPQFWFASLLLICINAPWMGMMWSVSNVGKFLKAENASHGVNYQQGELQISDIDTLQAQSSSQSQQAAFRHKSGGFNIKKSLKVVRETAISTNPLLLFLALPGLFLQKRNSTRWLIGCTSIWLFFLGSILVPVKPQLELDRMLVVMSLCLALPTATALKVLFEKSVGGMNTVLPALAFGFLLVGPFETGSMLSNRTLEQYHLADKPLYEVANAIQEHGGAGRIAFSGFILHELNEGHLAPLSAMTGKPLMASSQFHNLWKYTQIVPKDYLVKDIKGIEEYFDTYNVSAVFAHERWWRQKFTENPDKYQLVWKNGHFMLFKRLAFRDNYFFSGKGSFIAQDSNSFRVRVESPEAVLKFNYLPFLRSSLCDIGPYQASSDVTLIKLSNCPPGAIVNIDAVSPMERLFGGLKEND